MRTIFSFQLETVSFKQCQLKSHLKIKDKQQDNNKIFEVKIYKLPFSTQIWTLSDHSLHKAYES